jgi:MiaB/RimO family radical SAM methylthiotransferase
MLKTFSIQTLGCRVNQYEADQMAAMLRELGLRPADPADPLTADLRIVHSCSVTVQAASKSRQLARRAGAAARQISLDQLPSASHGGGPLATAGECQLEDTGPGEACPTGGSALAGNPDGSNQFPRRRARVIVTGCWATSDPAAAASLPGVDAVVGHHQDVAAEIARLLLQWQGGEDTTVPPAAPTEPQTPNAGPRAMTNGADADLAEHAPKSSGDNGWMMEVGAPAGTLNAPNKPSHRNDVNGNLAGKVPPGSFTPLVRQVARAATVAPAGTTALPVLGDRQSGRQRAYLKVQDGCDAHCTYCIIPRLRPTLWGKPVDVAIEEATRLVAAGHVELVLTGIFLGAYGQPTALRRRQPHGTDNTPLGRLVEALCTRVPGLRRLRLSSLEPGDLTPDLLRVLRSHRQVVPHFHLPLQSGSDAMLRRMNRQYTRTEFLRMLDEVRAAFDRPALTTDIIVGFPGETDAEFDRTLEVVDAAGFIHVHAFSYSPRPGTAAARWQRDVVRGPVVNERIDTLRDRAAAHSLAFRRQFVGQPVEVLVEREKPEDGEIGDSTGGLRHGRSERYFAVHFDDPTARPGDSVCVRVNAVTMDRTLGTRIYGTGDVRP